jgi:hypothetical protein
VTRRDPAGRELIVPVLGHEPKPGIGGVANEQLGCPALDKEGT